MLLFDHNSNLGSQTAIVGCPRGPCLRVSDSYVDSFGDLFCLHSCESIVLQIQQFWYASVIAGFAVLCGEVE